MLGHSENGSFLYYLVGHGDVHSVDWFVLQAQGAQAEHGRASTCTNSCSTQPIMTCLWHGHLLPMMLRSSCLPLRRMWMTAMRHHVSKLPFAMTGDCVLLLCR